MKRTNGITWFITIALAMSTGMLSVNAVKQSSFFGGVVTLIAGIACIMNVACHTKEGK